MSGDGGQRDITSSSSSSPSGSINTLQIALVAMKERCQRQQKRVEELERENLLMAEVRADLYIEVKRLHETNVKLREKNLQLNQELRMKSNECVEVREKLSRARTSNSSNVKQLERLQNEVSMITNRQSRTRSDLDDDTGDQLQSGEMLMSLTPDLTTMETSSCIQEEGDTLKLLDKTSSRMKNVKQDLLTEQQTIVEAIQTLKQRQAVAAQNAESLISASIAAAQKYSAVSMEGTGDRRCPMCEVAFPQTVSHEQFESHVVEHFSYEESDTLTNFDTVPDAYWSGPSPDEELMYR